jgi:hypothetical protein
MKNTYELTEEGNCNATLTDLALYQTASEDSSQRDYHCEDTKNRGEEQETRAHQSLHDGGGATVSLQRRSEIPEQCAGEEEDWRQRRRRGRGAVSTGAGVKRSGGSARSR